MRGHIYVYFREYSMKSICYNYFTQIAAIHEHADNIRTVGLGEIIAVLNGVDFRTRHNDFRLNMPHTESTEFHAFEPIPFPPVPPEVLQHGNNITEQVLYVLLLIPIPLAHRHHDCSITR